MSGSEDAQLLGVWDLCVVALYFGLILGVGISATFRKGRNTVSGFFLAGRHMFWLPVGASLFASNIGSEHFIGLSGTGAASGISVAAFEFNALFLLQLLGFVFLPVYIASKVCTLPEYMMKRFGGQRIRMYLACLSLMLYVFTKISVNLYSGALFIQQALQWNIYWSILLLLFLASICTICGGLAAVIYIDVVQVAIMLIGSSFLLFMGLKEVGGWSMLQQKYIQAIPNETFVNPNTNGTCGYPGEDSWVLLRAPTGSDMPWPGFLLGQTPASIWYWCADQIMVQKALSAKSLSDAQGATILTGWIKVLPMFLIVIPGMISRVLYPNEVGCVDPESCMAICQNPISCSNIAYPRLVLGIMPVGFRGLMISVMIAALMSDLTSIFNSASTLFTMDVYRKFRSTASAKELLLTGRLCICVLVAVSIGWIPIIQTMQGGQLYIYIQSIAAYLSPPIAAVFCLSIVWKRMNEQGAFWSLMFGLVIGAFRMILDFSYPEPLCMEEDTRPAFIGQVHYMYFAAMLFNMTIATTVIISLATPPDEEYRLIRTTFWTRHSHEVRPDDDQGAEKVHALLAKNHEVLALGKHYDQAILEQGLNKDHSIFDQDQGNTHTVLGKGQDKVQDQVRANETELEALNQDTALEDGKLEFTEKVISPRLTVINRIRSYLYSLIILNPDEMVKWEAATKKDADNVDKISNLEQSKLQRIILLINLVLILCGAVFLYVFFSINPFTHQDILTLREAVETNRSIYL